MPEKRIFHPRTRKSGLRDARLIIIAAEGTKTEEKYFNDLKNEYANPRVHVEPLERLDTVSTPEHVLAQLDHFRSSYRLRSGYDELWLVIDVDRWPCEKLAQVCRQTVQKKYELAVSNPCFELWLLLHHRSLRDCSAEEREAILKNRRDGTTRTYLERELIRILTRFNKEDLATEDYLPYVRQAIERARELDTDLNARWPNEIGSRVYRLVVHILPSGA